jgi:hypothetical protein
MPSNHEYILRLLSSKIFHQGDYLIKLMLELGYKSAPKGVCDAFSIIGIQAFLSGDFKSFQERMALLMIEKDRMLTAAKTLVPKLQSDKSITQFNLTDDEKKVMELRNFFDNLEVVVNPEAYEEMLGKKIGINNPYEVLPFVASNAIEDAGGLIAMEGWPGLYKGNEEYINYIDALQQSVMQAGSDIGFQLNGNRHAISFIYDAKKSQWTMIDASNLQTIFNPVEHGTLARLLFGAFNSERDANATDDEDEEQGYSYIFGTIPFSTGKNLEATQQWINNFKNHPAFIAAHTITDKKATIVTEHGNTLAHMAAFLGQTKILDEIKAHGGDIEKHIYAGRTVANMLEEKEQNVTNKDRITEDVFMHYLTEQWDEDDELKLDILFRKSKAEFIPILIEFLKIGGLTKYIKDTEDLKALGFLNDAEKNTLLDNFGISNLVNLVKKENDVYIIRDLLPENKRTEFFNALDSANISYTLDKLQNNQVFLDNIAAGRNQELIENDGVFTQLSKYSLSKLKSFIDNVDSATLRRIFGSKESIVNNIVTLPPFLMKDLINKIDTQTMQKFYYSRASDLESSLQFIPVHLHADVFEKMNAEKLSNYIRDSSQIAAHFKEVKASISAEKMQVLMNAFIQQEFLEGVKKPDQLYNILSVIPDADRIILVNKMGFQWVLDLANQSTQLSSLIETLPESAREFIIINGDKKLLADFMLNCMMYSFARISVPLRELLFERFTDEEIISLARTTSRLDNILENLPPLRTDKFLDQLHESIQNKTIWDDSNFKSVLEERQRDKLDAKIEETKPIENPKEEAKSENRKVSEDPIMSPEVNSDEVANLFKKIYSAILAGESRFFKYDFMIAKNNNLSSEELIKIIAADTDHPDVKKAWDLTNKYFNQPIAHDKKTYDQLFSEIYLYAFERSGLFKRAKVDGKSFYNTDSLKTYLDERHNGVVPEKTDNNPSNRTAKITSILRR